MEMRSFGSSVNLDLTARYHVSADDFHTQHLRNVKYHRLRRSAFQEMPGLYLIY